MRRSRGVKAETREAIVTQAARLFRERGIEGTSVSDVMAEAGLTHGGFYRHFEHKQALVEATVRAAFDEITQAIERGAATVGAREAVKDYLAFYLSDRHVANPGLGCPVPTLAGEVSRGPAALKAEFATRFNQSLATIAKGFPGPDPVRRATATRELAMHVGALLIARASDPATAEDVLAACRAPASAPSHDDSEG